MLRQSKHKRVWDACSNIYMYFVPYTSFVCCFRGWNIFIRIKINVTSAQNIWTRHVYIKQQKDPRLNNCRIQITDQPGYSLQSSLALHHQESAYYDLWCKTHSHTMTPFDAPGNKPFENTVEKGEIAHNEQFLLFPLCFLIVWITFFHFRQIWNCRLQTLSVWKSLKFVIW